MGNPNLHRLKPPERDLSLAELGSSLEAHLRRASYQSVDQAYGFMVGSPTIARRLFESHGRPFEKAKERLAALLPSDVRQTLEQTYAPVKRTGALSPKKIDE